MDLPERETALTTPLRAFNFRSSNRTDAEMFPLSTILFRTRAACSGPAPLRVVDRSALRKGGDRPGGGAPSCAPEELRFA